MDAEILLQIQPLLQSLSREDKVRLLDQLTKELQPHTPMQRTEVKGIWANVAPADFDLDAALKEIRHQWQEDLAEMRPDAPAEER